MLARRLILPAIAALFVAAPLARAQDAKPLMFATCNPAKVFEQMDERKVIQDKLNLDKSKISNEAQRRKLEIEEIRKQMSELNATSDLYKEKAQQALEKSVQFEVWARLSEQSMARSEKEQIKALFDKIREATKVVAERKKIDIVFAEKKPELPASMEQMTPDQVRAVISQNDVLYSNGKADITDLVVAELNANYAKAKPANGGGK